MSLVWRDTRWQVSACVGPERIGPEWWRGAKPTPERDYFAVQVQTGRWLWVCRQTGQRGRWFVHGEWS
jgi:protein ImuB